MAFGVRAVKQAGKASEESTVCSDESSSYSINGEYSGIVLAMSV